jgi:hypothetical protein
MKRKKLTARYSAINKSLRLYCVVDSILFISLQEIYMEFARAKLIRPKSDYEDKTTSQKRKVIPLQYFCSNSKYSHFQNLRKISIIERVRKAGFLKYIRYLKSMFCVCCRICPISRSELFCACLFTLTFEIDLRVGSISVPKFSFYRCLRLTFYRHVLYHNFFIFSNLKLFNGVCLF